MAYRAIIWDADGVLWHSTNIIITGVQRTAQQLGLPIPNRKFLAQRWGGTLHEFWQRIAQDLNWSTTDCNMLESIYQKLTRDEKPDIEPRLTEILSALHSCGCCMTVLSNRTEASLRRIMRFLEIRECWFAHIQGADSYQFRKPDVRALEPILVHCVGRGIRMEEMAFIGDSIDHDLAVAKAAGITFVGVCSGVHTPEEFKQSGVPDALIVPHAVDAVRAIGMM